MAGDEVKLMEKLDLALYQKAFTAMNFDSVWGLRFQAAVGQLLTLVLAKSRHQHDR